MDDTLASDEARPGAESALPTHHPSHLALVLSARRVGLVSAIVIVILIAAVRLAMWAWTQPVSFDGGMNLEVARSLAEGHGFRRMYGDHEAFSHAIQTRAPYILPAAAVFAAFGVGIWQTQLVNLLYVFALALLAFFLLRRWTSWRWGLLAAGVCLCTPGIEDNAMNGYGEVPALVWWLSALLVLYRPHELRVGTIRCVAAGVLIGMAVVTKTVLLIGLVAVVPVFLVEQWRGGCDRRSVVIATIALLAGVLLPILLHEAWRSVALGDWAHWKAWLKEELHHVQLQAGTQAGFTDTPKVVVKVLRHFNALAAFVGLTAWLLALWFGLGVLLLSSAGRRLRNSAARPLLLTLAAFALIYFVWWLGVTPTQKAWYRRIFDGVTIFELLIVLAAALFWRDQALAKSHLAKATAVLACVLQACLAWSSLSAHNWPTSGHRDALVDALKAMDALPGNAPLYGVGWYSTPTMALYSGLHINDLQAQTPAGLAAQSPVFLLLDAPAWTAGAERYWLQRYPNRRVASTAGLRIYELSTARVRDPFEGAHIDAAVVRRYVDFHDDEYPYEFGYHEREGEGWRWARADTEVLLRYVAESKFKIDMYVPAMSAYRARHALGVTVWLDGCRLGTLHQDRSVRMQWQLPSGNCPLQDGQIVHARLVSDNTLDSRDDRQMSLIVYGLGFETVAASP
jgi:4-amino-4-deoxy-L-arabinose transferase-like glycosyltransferase